MILCGQDFANEVINQFDKSIQITWLYIIMLKEYQQLQKILNLRVMLEAS